MGFLIEIAAGLLCVLAGGYLLLSQTAAPDSYLQVLGHGAGLYFIGKGLFVFRSCYLQAEANEKLERIARQTNEPPPSR